MNATNVKLETVSVPWAGATLPMPTRDAEQLRRDFDEFGYGLIDKALDPEILSAIQTRLFEQAAAERSFYKQQNPANPVAGAQWVNMLLNKGAVFFQLIRHPLAMSIIEHALGPDYLISCVDSQIQHPGTDTMPMHTDQWWMPPLAIPGEPQKLPSTVRREWGESCDPTPAKGPIAPRMVANVMWMITDFREETGATRIVPKSHLSGRAPDTSVPHKIPSIPAIGPAGTAFVFDGRLWHAAWANTSNEIRYGITTACCGPQCRQIENYARGMRPEVLASCSPELLPRLGLSAWSSYGHTGDITAVPTKTGEESTGELHLAQDSLQACDTLLTTP